MKQDDTEKKTSSADVPVVAQESSTEVLARSRAVIAAMNDAIAQGNKAIDDYDAFAERHGITPDCGREALAGKDAYPARKFVFKSLMFELDHLEERINDFAQDGHAAGSATGPPAVAKSGAGSKKKPRSSIAARSLGNRFRV